MSLFSDLFGSGYQSAAQAQIAGINAGINAETPYYGKAVGNVTDYGAAALAPYTDVFNTGTTGVNMYGNALGLGGAAGNAAALAGFQNNPGYQFQLGQGEQAVDRGAASRGMVTSGNTLNAEDQYAQGLANQSWQQYVSNLAPYFNQQATGAAGIANVNQNTGTSLANLNLGQGNFLNNAQLGIGNATAAADTAQQNATNSFINGLVQAGGQILGYAAGRTPASAPKPA